MIWKCPKGHEVDPVFALDDVRRDVALGEQTCFCRTCGEGYPLPPHVQNNILGHLETLALSSVVDEASFAHHGTGYRLSVVGVHIDAVPFPARSANVHLVAIENHREGWRLPFELSVGLSTLRDAAAMIARAHEGLALAVDALSA